VSSGEGGARVREWKTGKGRGMDVKVVSGREGEVWRDVYVRVGGREEGGAEKGVEKEMAGDRESRRGRERRPPYTCPRSMTGFVRERESAKWRPSVPQP
jgi:hypothetical protein